MTIYMTVRYYKVYVQWHMLYRIIPVRSCGSLLFSVLDASHEIHHEYVTMILHPISISLAESSYLISNTYYTLRL